MVLRGLWKAGVGLLVVVPAATYVVSSLASSSADEPTPRPPIVIQAPARPTAGSAGGPGSTPASGAASQGPVGEVEIEPDDLEDDHDDWGRDDEHGDHRDDHGDDHGGGHDD